MDHLASSLSKLESLESRLTRVTDPYQRIELLNRLAGAYAYINVKKARKFLDEQDELLLKNDYPDFRLSYHLNNAVVENQHYNFNLSEIQFKNAIELLEERGDTKQLIEGYIEYAGTLMNLNKLVEATEYLEKAEKYLKNFPDPQLEAWHLGRQGFLNHKYLNYPKATELFLEADKRIRMLPRRLLKDFYFRTLILSSLGRIYEHTDDVSKSIKVFQEAVDICEFLKMRSRISWHYLNTGQAYMRKGDDVAAESFFRKAIEARDDISLDARAGAMTNLGSCYFRKGEYDEALKLYRRSEQIYDKTDEPSLIHLSIIESKKAQLYAAKEKHSKVDKHYANAINYAQEVKDKKQLSKVCNEVAIYKESLGNYREAYEYLQLHIKFQEIHLEQTKKQQLMELEYKYEAEKKKQEAELLKLQAVRLQLKALRSQMNPHFMFNSLNSIQKCITSKELDDASNYLAKFSRLMRQSLDYSDMEVITLEKEIEFLTNYLFINQKLRFKDKLTYKITLGDDIEEDIMGVPTMIVQPYVENAIEHGLRLKEDGMLKIDFSLANENTILCVIEDNGVGRELVRKQQEKDNYHINHVSKGTRITEQRLEILNKTKNKGVFVKTIDLVDKVTKMASGTRVEVLIPLEIIQKPIQLGEF